MSIYQNQTIFVPNNVPIKMSGKVTTKIVLKEDYIRTDGTCAIYLSVSIKGNRKRIPLQIAVEPSKFNKRTERIKGKTQISKDCNILIEKALSRVNEIELTYRLNGKILDTETLCKEYTNPTPNYDFLKFYEYELEHQKKFLNKNTYRQQKSTLAKLKGWKDHIAFSSIDENLVKELILHCKNVLNNKNVTISTTLKNFKKYLHAANKKGIRTTLEFDDIKVPVFKGNRTFLVKEEIQKIYKYWSSEFINKSHQMILSKFLFSVFTSLRISDIQSISRDNIIEGHLVYNSKKTGKFNKIKLSESAKKFIQPEGVLFLDTFSPEYINRELKLIMYALGIKKRVTFHVARHTFATNFLINGGNVINLQKIMDHSNIRETMIYVHIVDSVMNEEISLMDNILN